MAELREFGILQIAKSLRILRIESAKFHALMLALGNIQATFLLLVYGLIIGELASSCNNRYYTPFAYE